MVKLHYFILAENYILDNTGRVSIINIFSELNSVTDMATALKFALIISVTPQKEDLTDGMIKFKVQVLKPDGTTHFEVEGGGDVPKEKIGNIIISPLDLSGVLQFDIEGDYTVKLFANGKQLSELGFIVNLNQKVSA